MLLDGETLLSGQPIGDYSPAHRCEMLLQGLARSLLVVSVTVLLHG